MKTTWLLPVLSAAALGCDIIIDFGGHPHGECTAEYNDTWEALIDYDVRHDDFRSCPYTANYLDPVSSGGIVYDVTRPPPNEGNSDDLIVQAHEDKDFTPGVRGQCREPISDPAIDSFAFGQPRPGSPYSEEWVAEGWVFWVTKINPDYVCFTVTFIDTSHLGRAFIKITFSGYE